MAMISGILYGIIGALVVIGFIWGVYFISIEDTTPKYNGRKQP